MGGICSGVEEGQRPLKDVAVTAKGKEIGNVMASFKIITLVPLPPRPRRRRRSWRHSGRYIRASSALALVMSIRLLHEA
jgi:hypothetical protein